MNVLICDTNVNYQGTLFLMKIYFTIFTLTKNKSSSLKENGIFQFVLSIKAVPCMYIKYCYFVIIYTSKLFNLCSRKKF